MIHLKWESESIFLCSSFKQQPGSEYICHVTANGGSTPTLEAIIAKFQQLSIKYDKVCAIGCDGTVVNTGPHAGIVCLLEKHLQKPVHWFICLLHANELPLRHLITNLDGKTMGPNAWSGPIGRSISKVVWNEGIVDFKRIKFKCNIDNIDSVAASFKTDQKLPIEYLQGNIYWKFQRRTGRTSYWKSLAFEMAHDGRPAPKKICIDS